MYKLEISYKLKVILNGKLKMLIIILIPSSANLIIIDITSSIFPKYNIHKDIIIISQIIINHLIKLGCCERNSKCLFNKVDIVVNKIPIPKISVIFIVILNNEFLEIILGSFFLNFKNFINDDDDLFDLFEKENTLIVVFVEFDLDDVCLFFRKFIVKKIKI